MHLTAEETYTLVGALVAVLGAAASWLRASAAHRAAGRAESKANQALNGTAGQAANSQAGDGAQRPPSPPG